MRILICIVMLLSAGCAAELTEQGRMVREIRPDWSTKCVFLGVVDAPEGRGYDVSDNRRGALNTIRNRVAQVGGNAYVITDINSNEFRTYIQADAYKCPVFKMDSANQ